MTRSPGSVAQSQSCPFSSYYTSLASPPSPRRSRTLTSLVLCFVPLLVCLSSPVHSFFPIHHSSSERGSHSFLSSLDFSPPSPPYLDGSFLCQVLRFRQHTRSFFHRHSFYPTHSFLPSLPTATRHAPVTQLRRPNRHRGLRYEYANGSILPTAVRHGQDKTRDQQRVQKQAPAPRTAGQAQHSTRQAGKQAQAACAASSQD